MDTPDIGEEKNCAAHGLSWSRLYRSRRGIRKRFPSIWSVPIKKRIVDILCTELRHGTKMLDIGACDRSLYERIKDNVPGLEYKSMDVDQRNPHDFYSLEAINESFDLVCMLECIEHLNLETGRQTLCKIFQVLRPGGKLLISTPNIFHPNRYWECTHQVPFRYDELGGLIELCGLGVRDIFRIYNDHYIGRLFRVHVMYHLHRYLDVDFAKSILVVAQKSRMDVPEACRDLLPGDR